MLSSLNLLASSATDEHPQDVRTSRCPSLPPSSPYLLPNKKEEKREICTLTIRGNRIHVPIAPNPHPSARTSEPSSSGSPDHHAQYRYRPWDNGRSGVNGDRSRTRRARPLIQNKCEECVVARQKVFASLIFKEVAG